MPAINIYEHSETYSFQTRNLAYGVVAFPITAIWGPCRDNTVADESCDDANPDWLRFESGYRGTTDFVNTFKGPNTALGPREKSYEYALKLLSAGYDILVKRVDGLGNKAQGEAPYKSTRKLTVTAKYPGSYGSQLKVRLLTTYQTGTNNVLGTVEVYDRNNKTGNDTAIVSTDKLLEIIPVALDMDGVTDDCPYYSDAEFSYIEGLEFSDLDTLPSAGESMVISLTNVKGTDVATDDTGVTGMSAKIVSLLQARFGDQYSNSIYAQYLVDQTSASSPKLPAKRIQQIWNLEQCVANALDVIPELIDPITYDWDVIFMAVGDDQYVPSAWKKANATTAATLNYKANIVHDVLAETAANSKCGCAFFGTPFGMPRGGETSTGVLTGAAKYKDEVSDRLESYSTYAQVVGPWCQTTLAVSGSNAWCCPEVAHLLLIINSQGTNGINKWWMVPAGMTSNGTVHSPEYKIKKATLDILQNHEEGVCLNPIMEVPGKGLTVFGNSTLWNKPLGTYNALQNLSTRLLANRVKQRIWDTALTILFKYNNQDAYSHFYAGVSPLLDEMRAVGALTGTDANPYGYRITMNPDIINLDRINANTVIGKVELAVTGVIDTVDVDLFLLPPNAFDAV